MECQHHFVDYFVADGVKIGFVKATYFHWMYQQRSVDSFSAVGMAARYLAIICQFCSQVSRGNTV